jgi:hypothetical protein
VLLADKNPADLRAVANKADKLVALHSPQSHDMAAAVNKLGSYDKDETTQETRGTRSHPYASTMPASATRPTTAGLHAPGRKTRWPRRRRSRRILPRHLILHNRRRFQPLFPG